jgi:hypothetical protein
VTDGGAKYAISRGREATRMSNKRTPDLQVSDSTKLLGTIPADAK